MGPEGRRTGHCLIAPAGKDERARLAHVTGCLCRDHCLAEPVPHDGDIRAADAALLLFFGRLRNDEIFERPAKQTQWRGRAFDIGWPAQRRTQSRQIMSCGSATPPARRSTSIARARRKADCAGKPPSRLSNFADFSGDSMKWSSTRIGRGFSLHHTNVTGLTHPCGGVRR